VPVSINLSTYNEMLTNYEVLGAVGYATRNEWYNEQFLSIKSACYNEYRCYNEYKCYNERGGILSADVARACA